MSTMLNRDTFLKLSVAGGSGLALGFSFRGEAAAKGQIAVFNPNAYVAITPDGLVTIQVSKSEMGQGVMTGLPMTIAEELDYPFEKLRIEQSPAAPEYYDPVMKSQQTHGSSTTPDMTIPMRQMGAMARAMLVAAAAEKWGVPASSLVTKGDGMIYHPPSGRSGSYGEFALLAALQPVPKDVQLKSPDQFRIIGQRKNRVDVPSKVNGRAKFGMDVKVPGMLYASVQKPAVFGGKVVSYDATEALKVKGVKKVVQIASGVAVLADNTWSAMQGRFKLKVRYDDGKWANLSSDQIFAEAEKLANSPGAVAKHTGDADAAMKRPDVKVVAATYRGPYLAHATMEPMNATAWVHDGIVEIWAPTQHQTPSQDAASKITGIPLERIKLTTTFLGGGFGRKGETDFVEDAVEASMKAGVPVKVVYSREDDTQHDYYRSANTSVFSGAVDSTGKIVAYKLHNVNTSQFKRALPFLMAKTGVDPSIAGSTVVVYDLPNVHAEYTYHDLPIPTGFWRAPSTNWNSFATEVFIDELAHAAGKDPYEFRRMNIKDPRALRALDAAAEKAGWGKPLPPGVYRGIAITLLSNSIAANVLEASFSGKNVTVHRVVVATDVGMVINPAIVEAQARSSVNYALSAALMGKATIEKGRVVQNNFYDAPVLRHNQAPAIEVLVMPSGPTAFGTGEHCVGAVAPALVGAYFAATGKRIRALPISDALA
ncbi:MAG TPA: molybdopterin cofactor-binding domain-containing protein [Candidatus Binatia bacterium]|nr:molybdopterin cofactor-binding domain-containing protein [Candidatus Binatia bacterium]